MTEDEWLSCHDSHIMFEFLHGGHSDRKLRLFAVESVRPFRYLLVDERSRDAVRLAERVADDPQRVTALAVAHRNAWAAVPELPAGRQAHVSAARAAGRTVETSPFRASWTTWNEIVGLHTDLREEAGRTDDERDALHFQGRTEGEHFMAGVVREVFGYPFRRVAFPPDWRTDTTLSLAGAMYDTRDFSAMPILADALQDAGCDNHDVLSHCRQPGTHVRGCWVVDRLLGKT